jgi:excisionase family DNA binding protein
MRERLFSTTELGRLLRVSEATVKRWADTERIGCFRTPGGHRKFRLCDIAAFVERTGYEITAALSALLHDGRTDRSVEAAVQQDDLRSLAAKFEDRAIRGDVDGLHGMLSCLRTRGVCLASALDEVVSPAFASIGERWARGEISVVEEHVATNSTEEALGRLASPGASPGEAPALALCACLEGERHDLGARAASIVLEGCGYRAVHAGANIPVADLETHLRVHPTAILALSSKAPADPVELERQALHLARAARRAGTWMVLGGVGFSLLSAASRQKLSVVDSCRELVAAVEHGEAIA